jgi:hypothetical protein
MPIPAISASVSATTSAPATAAVIAATLSCGVNRAAQALVILATLFKKVGDIKEGISFQPDVNKGALHARKHARYPALVDAAN